MGESCHRVYKGRREKEVKGSVEVEQNGHEKEGRNAKGKRAPKTKQKSYHFYNNRPIRGLIIIRPGFPPEVIGCLGSHRKLVCLGSHRKLGCFGSRRKLSCLDFRRKLGCFGSRRKLGCLDFRRKLSCFGFRQMLGGFNCFFLFSS